MKYFISECYENLKQRKSYSRDSEKSRRESTLKRVNIKITYNSKTPDLHQESSPNYS